MKSFKTADTEVKLSIAMIFKIIQSISGVIAVNTLATGGNTAAIAFANLRITKNTGLLAAITGKNVLDTGEELLEGSVKEVGEDIIGLFKKAPNTKKKGVSMLNKAKISTNTEIVSMVALAAAVETNTKLMNSNKVELKRKVEQVEIGVKEVRKTADDNSDKLKTNTG